MTGTYIAADPYPWPYNGDLRPDNTALLVIDMQTDFCGVGDYVDRMGYDLSLTRAPIGPIKSVLAAMRAREHVVDGGRDCRQPLGFWPGRHRRQCRRRGRCGSEARPA